MGWREDTRRVLEEYYTTKHKEMGAIEAALAMANMVLSTQKALTGAPDAAGMARMLNDYLFLLPSNVYWNTYGPELMTALRTSWTSFIEASEHADLVKNGPDADREAHKVQMMRMREQAITVIPVAVFNAMPTENMHRQAAKLRTELLKSEYL